MKLETKIKGFENLNTILTKLPERVEANVLQKSTTGALRSIVKYMRGRAPKNADYESPASKKYGPLRKNIFVKASKRDKKSGTRGAYITTGKAFWGFFYEKGTRHQPARPWFLPAFSAVSDLIIKRFADNVSEGILKEVEKLKKIEK